MNLKNILTKISAYKIISIVLLFLLFIKSILFVDTSFDTWDYHYPFAARIWGIVPASQYTMDAAREESFLGFGMVTEFLQGFIWKLTGRIELTNLLSFGSLCGYIFFLWKYLKIPFESATLALLAVPLILIHSTLSLSDLFPNFCLSAFLVLAFLMSFRQGEINTKNIVILLFLGIFVGNSKFTLIPILFLSYFALSLRFIFIKDKEFLGNFSRKILLILIFIGFILACGTCLKNLIFYSNPFYPVEISLGWLHFNGPFPPYTQIPKYLINAPRILQWFLSVTEIDWLIRKDLIINYYIHRDLIINYYIHHSHAYFPPLVYKPTMDFFVGNFISKPGSLFVNRDGAPTGGFFGPYVLFQFFLLLYYYLINTKKVNLKKKLSLIKSNEHKNVQLNPLFISLFILTLLTGFLPQSLELRYYMYWIIVLITANLYIAIHYYPEVFKLKWLNFISSLVLVFVLFITKFYYFNPNNFSSLQFIVYTNIPVVEKIKQLKSPVCLKGYVPYTFQYAAYFNDGKYSLHQGESSWSGASAQMVRNNKYTALVIDKKYITQCKKGESILTR